MKEDKPLFEYKGWHIVGKLGSGSFGTVYEIEREDFGYQYKTALKVISIPNSEQDLSQVKNNIGKSDDSLEVYYESVVSEIVKEFELMYKLRGTTNIVSYEDHEVRKHKGGIGWDVMIRMELLTPLDTYRKTNPMGRKEIIQLGIDICKALERCSRYHIIHRDIKPGNIFVSEQGDFKLGDFGIARTIEAHDVVLELSKKGTINYMAPEMFMGNRYDASVDLYSLGIVMYRFLNNNTLPFFPVPPKQPTYKEVNLANQKRFAGEPLPCPCGDNTQLADVVLKACSYNPEERYQSPMEMREALEMVLRGDIIEEFDDKTVRIPPGEIKKRHRKGRQQKKVIVIILLFLICVLGVSMTILLRRRGEVKSSESMNVENQNKSIGSDLQSLIEEKDFVASYKMIQDSTDKGENLDEEIRLFVQACKEELEYKRIVAVMKLLSEDVTSNEAFYKETIQWFYGRKQDVLAREILSDLRGKGTEGVNLADIIGTENNVTDTNEE